MSMTPPPAPPPAAQTTPFRRGDVRAPHTLVRPSTPSSNAQASVPTTPASAIPRLARTPATGTTGGNGPESPLAAHPYLAHTGSSLRLGIPTQPNGAAGAATTPSQPQPTLITPSTTPARPGHRVSRSVGCFPVSPAVGASEFGFGTDSPRLSLREPVLPLNPAVWTTSELAQHLGWALRTGGTDGTGPTLPQPVVDDVVTWVLRSRVCGKQFTRGIDGWSGSRPPPFLPVLAQMSRRLRRVVGHPRASTTFSEADALDEYDEDDDGVTRVKRVARAFDAITSASEASDSEPSLSFLRQQLTGDSVEGFGRATPKHTDTPVWARRARRDSTASAMSAASGMSTASGPIWCDRRDSMASSVASTSWALPAEVGVAEVGADYCLSPSPAEAKKRTEAEAEASSKEEAAQETSPPPPYHPEPGLPSPAAKGLLFPTAPVDSPVRSGSTTPLREQDFNIEESDHLLRMASHQAAGVNPYAALRRDKGRPSLPSVSVRMENEDGAADSDEEDDVWPAMRKVTARPSAADALAPLMDRIGERVASSSAAARVASSSMRVPSLRSVSRSSPAAVRRRRERERDMEKDMAALTDRIRELEERLAAVETTPVPTPPSPTPQPSPLESEGEGEGDEVVAASAPEHICAKCSSPTGSTFRPASPGSTISAASSTPSGTRSPPDLTPAERRRSWLRSFDLVDDDGDRPRLRDMPAYLFLMGMGVGIGFSAVVMRMLFAGGARR